MGDGRKDSFIPDAPAQETGTKDSFVPDAVDVKKKDTTGGASVPSPTMSTTPVGRSFASVTTGAKSASASTPSAVKLPNFIYNQNLYTGSTPSMRPTQMQRPITEAKITGDGKTYSWSPSETTPAPEPKTVTTYSGMDVYPVKPQRQSLAEAKRNWAIAEQENYANKAAFVQANPGVNVDLSQPNPIDRAKAFSDHYLLNNDPARYSDMNNKVDYWNQKVAENNNVENVYFAQKARVEKDMYAVNLMFNATEAELKNKEIAFDKTYGAQLDQLDELESQYNMWPKNEDGTPVINSEQERENYNNIVASYQSIMDNEDFAQARQSIMKDSEDMQALYDSQKEIIKANPLFFMAEDMAKKAAVQTEADLAKLGPMFQWKAKNIDNPATQAVVDFALGIAYIPKAFGDGDDYGWTDALYEKAKTGTDLGISPYLPVEDSIVAKVVSAGTTMALMMATGYAMGAGGVALGLPARASMMAGQAAAGTVATMEGYYRAGVEAGMTESEAESYSIVNGLVQGMLEMVNPEAVVAPRIFKDTSKAYLDVLVSGGTKKAARIESTKRLVKSVLGNVAAENTQELLQQVSEWGVNMKANQITGATLDVGENWGETLKETAIITTVLSGITGGIMSGGVVVKENRLASEATYITGKEPLKYKERVASMLAAGEITQEKAAEINAKIDQAQQIVSKIPSNIPPSEAVNQIPALMEKIRLDEELKKVDPAFKPAVEEQIAQVEKQMQQQAGIVPEEEKDQKAMEADMEEMENLRVSKTMMERMGMSLQPEELARLTELENKLTPKEDATQKGIKPEGDQQQHQNTPQGGETTEAVSGDSTQQSGQVQEEITSETEQVQPPETKVEKPDESKAEVLTAEEDAPEEVQRLNDDIEALNSLSYAKAAKKATAVKQRIANAVKSGAITPETGKKYSEQADAIVKQKVEEVKQRADKAIDEAAETMKAAGEKLGIIGKSYYINPQTGERVEVQKNSILDPVKLIDIGASMVKRAVGAGIDINVAINSWAEAVKNHPAYKNLVSTQGQDKADEFVAKAKQSFMTAAQSVDPPDAKTKTSRIAKTMMESDKISDDVKKGLESTGLEYVPQGQKLQAEEADAIIGWHEQYANLEGVLDMVTDMSNGMKPDARAMLATQLYNRYTEMQAQAVTEGNAELATKYAYRAGQALGRANNIISDSARALRNAARQIHETLRRYGVEAMVAQMSGMVQGKVQQIMQRGSTKKTIKTATSEIDKFWKMFSSKVPDKTARKSKIDRMVEMAERLDNINGTTEYSDRVKEYQKILAEDAEAKAIDKLMTDLENKLTQVSDRTKRRKIIVNALNELNEKGKLSDDRVKKLVEEALFEQEFTPELQDMLRKGFQIMKDYVDIDASRQEAIKKLRDDYTEAMKTATPEEGSKLTKAFRADVKKVYDELVEARFKAEEQHAKIAEQFLEDRGLLDMLRMTLPSNLFTSGGILTNLYFNLADVFPRVARAVMASGMDIIILPIQNRIRVKKGLSPLTRTNRFGAQLMGIHLYGAKYGLKEARFRSLKGIQSVEDMEKFEMRRSLKPIDAAISLFRKKRPNQRMYRFVEDKIAAAIEATSGSFSSVLLRAMSLGDVGPREVARFGKLYEIAVTTKGLTEPEDITEFVFHPDEESAKYAEEYAKELVFQKDRNKISLETLTKVMKGESLDGVKVSPDVASQAVQLIGDLIDLPASGIEAHTKGSESEALREAGRYSAEAYRYFATSQFPFKNTYLRMIPRVLEMAWPGMSIAKATLKFMKAAESLNKMDELPDTPANKEARDKLKFAHDMYRNEGLAAVSQAAIATSIAATAVYFVAQGIITGGDDKDELGRQSGRGPYKLNLSALTRIWEGEGWNKDKDGDVWVSYDWFGMNGLVLGATVDKLKKDGQIPGIDANLSILDAIKGAGLNILPKSLDMPLIKSSETLLDALRKGDNSMEKWEANTLSAMITGIYPNILQAVSRTADEYDRDIRSGDADPSKPGVQKSGVDEAGNRLLVSTYRGDKLPPKVDIFGHDIKSTTTGQDWVWRGNAEKTDVNSPNYRLWQLRQQFPPDSPSWRAITPSPLEIEQTFNYYLYGKTKVSKTISLDPWQLHDLSQQVGIQREQALKMYMSTPQWEQDTPAQKAENIEKLWRDATAAGKMHYMMEHPEIISQD